MDSVCTKIQLLTLTQHYGNHRHRFHQFFRSSVEDVNANMPDSTKKQGRQVLQEHKRSGARKVHSGLAESERSERVLTDILAAKIGKE